MLAFCYRKWQLLSRILFARSLKCSLWRPALAFWLSLKTLPATYWQELKNCHHVFCMRTHVLKQEMVLFLLRK